MISVVIPTFNEVRHGYLEKILEFWAIHRNIFEVIVVDSGSEDGTQDLVKQFEFVRLVESKKRNRPGRLNDGAKIAKNDIILFHHPVSVLDDLAVESLKKLRANEFKWGAFHHKFDTRHWLLKFTSLYSNYIRGGLKHIYYLDHCLIVSKELHEKVGGWPEDDIFEDTIYSQKLAEIAKPERLKGTSITSARRFKQRGMYKHAFLNQIIKIMFLLGFDKEKINLIYEGKNPFNVKY